MKEKTFRLWRWEVHCTWLLCFLGRASMGIPNTQEVRFSRSETFKNSPKYHTKNFINHRGASSHYSHQLGPERDGEWQKDKLQLKGQYQLVILGCGSQMQPFVVDIPRISSDIHFLIVPLIITKLKTTHSILCAMGQNLTKGDEMNFLNFHNVL
jgi:hypothetical protein